MQVQSGIKDPVREPLFVRCSTDSTVIGAESLIDSFAGPFPSSAFLVGAGPSLARMPCREIMSAPVPKMCINLSGCNVDGEPPLIRPTFWTAYDTVSRFHRSVMLDPSVMKFVHRGRRMDVISGGSEKMVDCPSTYFFSINSRGYADFLDPAAGTIIDCRDSMIQAIDVLYRLGFRRIYMVGCELQIYPSPAQLELAIDAGVNYDVDLETVTFDDPATKGKSIRSSRLKDFSKACELKGISLDTLLSVEREQQYAFTEAKLWQATCATDDHYFDVVQYLRLARRSIAAAGVELISCTPGSRLNPYFRYCEVSEAIAEATARIGSPASEVTKGKYAHESVKFTRPPEDDLPPYQWNEQSRKPRFPPQAKALPPLPQPDQKSKLQQKFKAAEEVSIEINEEG